jgi:serine phosphatase RsbU (regulator of sigma subunit)
MRLIICERQNMISDLNVSGGIVLIGSHPSCDVYLPDGRLAPRQAIVEPEGDYGWTVRPLDTRLATTVNKSLLHSRYRLKNGDEIAFADYSVRVYIDEPVGATERAIPSVTRSDDTMVPTRWPLPQDTVILRSGDVVSLEGAGLLLLGQISSRIHRVEEPKALLECLAASLLSDLKADRAWVCLATDPEHDPHMVVALDTSGRPYKGPDKMGMLIHRAVQRQQTVLLPTDPTRFSSAIAAPLAAGAASLGLLYFDRAPGKPFFTKGDLAALRAIGSLAGWRLDEILRGHQQTIKQRAQELMEWAHQVQERLTPAAMPAWDNLEVAAYRQAGRSCCGDIYDVVRLPKGTAAVVLGHAMAAGAESAILMTQVRAAFRIALLHADAPHFLLKELNWLVHDPTARHAMRCFTGLLDPASGKLRYSVAGQIGAFLLHASGEAEDLVRFKTPEIGEQPQMAYNLEEAQIDGGESLVLFTRGLITATSAAGQPFGIERILTDLEDVPNKSAHVILQTLVDDLALHLANTQPTEDITILLLRRLP